MIRKFLLLTLFSFLLSKTSLAENIQIFDFSEIELGELEVRKVRGADNKTVYSVGSNENGNFFRQ